MARRKRDDPITSIDDPRYVKALAHPTRVRLLAMLREQRASPVQLSDRLGVSLGTTAYHVRTLKALGLIKLVGTRQRRGATEHYYEAVEDPRFTDAAWEAGGPVAKQRAIGAQLRQAGEFATGSAAAGGFDRSDAVLERRAVRLDERGWKDLAKATAKLLEQVQRIEAAAAERLAKADEAEALDAGVVLMQFEAIPLSGKPRAAGRATR
jgi:DNA-binding transcriptional ArsR family regulator